MRIVWDTFFTVQLRAILKRIASDKVGAARNFERQLNQTIRNLANFPYRCRASRYFEDESYRDLIYKGYTIIYKIDQNRIVVLDIFKWQERKTED